MKKIFFLVMALCFTGLVGCADHCGYPTGCWNNYLKETSCGSYLTWPCKKICDKCSFDEPSCAKCWSCMEHDSCGYQGCEMNKGHCVHGCKVNSGYYAQGCKAANHNCYAQEYKAQGACGSPGCGHGGCGLPHCKHKDCATHRCHAHQCHAHKHEVIWKE